MKQIKDKIKRSEEIHWCEEDWPVTEEEEGRNIFLARVCVSMSLCLYIHMHARVSV